MSASSSPVPPLRSPPQARSTGATSSREAGHRPFPPLVDDPEGLLALPPGFRYEVVTYAGKTKLRDGQGATPSNHDGTAVFDAGRNRLRLIQNHELGAGAALGVPHVTGTVYDPTALMAGGCTVIETDRRGRNHGEWVGISGTLTNCAGGPTPWGTWLTCEETEAKAGTAWTGNGQSGTYSRDHGYVFEVFARRQRRCPSRSRRSAATRTRRWRRPDPHPGLPLRGRQQPQRPLLPLDRARAASSSGPASPTSSAPTPAPSRRWRSSWTTARCCPTSPTSPRPSSAGRSGEVGAGARAGRTDHVGAQAVHRRDHPRQEVRGRLRHRQGRVRREQLRLQHRRPARRRRQARRHGVVLLLRGPDHHAGHLLPAPDHHRHRRRRPATTASSSTGPTT